MENGQLTFYQTPDGTVALDVRLERETIWLSLNQMALLFDRDKSVISRHLRSVFKEGELQREATVAKNATVQTEGDRTVARNVEFLNLDAILSVGYSVNQNRLRDLNQAVRLIADTVNRRDLSGDEARALLRVGPGLRERFGGSAVFGVEKDKGLASALRAVI